MRVAAFALVFAGAFFPWPAAAGGLGAVGPEYGTTQLELGGGVLFVVPQATVAARAGTGAGSSVELRYTNIAVVGHSIDGRVAWGAAIGPGFALGGALRTGLASLEQANDIGGLAWNNLAVGNDWVAGADIVGTWRRATAADITLQLGASVTIGGPRYTSFSEAEYAFDPGLRGLDATIQGEWDLREDKQMFIRLHGFTPLHTGLRPLGFFPTATGGISWLF